MKILFLDIDGVVNCQTTKERVNGVIGIELRLVALVKQIIENTGCKVVLSSSWRCYKPDLEHVKRYFLLEDITIDNKGLTDRGCEVKDWVEKHPEIERYAILDDNSDFHKEQPLFLTSWQTGITEAIAAQVTAHLNGAAL